MCSCKKSLSWSWLCIEILVIESTQAMELRPADCIKKICFVKVFSLYSWFLSKWQDFSYWPGLVFSYTSNESTLFSFWFCFKNMKKNTCGTSIVEALVVMVMISIGLSWLFGIFSESQKLSTSTEYRIQAIQIAREWIEAVGNIRDTNRLLFAADYNNCWNTRSYNNNCFWDTSDTHDMQHESSYILERDTNNRWVLTWAILRESRDFTDSNYRDDYRVYKDPDGFFVQTSGESFRPIFTREIRIDYIDDTNGDGDTDSSDEKLRATSIVQWSDPSSSIPKKIELQMELTNWKNER